MAKLEAVEPGTPAEFLLVLTQSLKAEQDVDADLLNILAEHILIDAPKETCVADARAQIVKLAQQRAAPAEVVSNV